MGREVFRQEKRRKAMVLNGVLLDGREDLTVVAS